MGAPQTLAAAPVRGCGAAVRGGARTFRAVRRVDRLLALRGAL
ncbi:MAG: hypothetical protein RL698_3741 [Pseudomonadota bacterium]